MRRRRRGGSAGSSRTCSLGTGSATVQGGWYRIEPAGVERMAAADPAHREPRATERSVLTDRFQCVRAARGLETATLREQWADEPPVAGDQGHQHARDR